MTFFERNKYYLSLHGVIFLWGFTGILGRLISIPSYAIVWWRVFIALLGLVAFMLVDKRPFQTTLKNRVYYLLTGVVTAAHWVFFFEALKVSNVSITLTTLASTSLFVALLEPILFKRKIIWYEIVLGLATIGGLALIFQAESQYALGIIYALISAVLAAMFSTVNGLFVKYDRPTLITAHEMLGAVLGMTAYMLIAGEPLVLPMAVDWVYLLILGLVCTSLAFVVSIEVMKELSPFTVSISINMEPIYAVAFALIIFREDEFMSPLFYAGAVIIMGIIFLNSYLKRKSLARKQVIKLRD